MSLVQLVWSGLTVAAIAFVVAIISLRLGPARPNKKAASGAAASGDSGGWFGDGHCDGGGD